MGQIDHHFQPIRLDIGHLEYNPTGVLGLDCSAIPSEHYIMWRKSQTKTQAEWDESGSKYQPPYPNNAQIGKRLGIKTNVCQRWNKLGIPEGPQAAWFRLVVIEQVQGFYQPATSAEVRALAHSVGGYEALGKEIMRSKSVINEWACADNQTNCTQAGIKSFAGPLVKTLFEDMKLDPWTSEHWPRPDEFRQFDERDIKAIRRRHEDGDTLKAISDDYGVFSSTIQDILLGVTYQWV